MMPRLSIVAWCALLAGCPGTVGSSRADGGARDAGDGAPTPDVAPPDPCADALDASRVGLRFGTTTQVRFDRAALRPVAPSLFDGCDLPPGALRMVTLRYTLRGDAALSVRARSQAGLAIVGRVRRIALLGRCGPGAPRLACGGDFTSPGYFYLDPAMADGALPAGTEVAIAVALEEGVGEVVITELTRSAAEGSACDARPSADACAAGTSCSSGADGVRRCVRDGRAFGLCRAAGERCDPGLRCIPSPVPGHRGQCVPLAGLGERCVPGACREGTCFGPFYPDRPRCQRVAPPGQGPACSRDEECAAGLRCLSTVCLAVTPVGGRCRLTAGPFDPELPCAPDAVCRREADGVARCASVRAAGAPCTPAAGACDEGLECRHDAASDAGACQARADGSRGAPCVTNTCAAGLACRGGVCGAPLAAGAPCADMFACGSGASCVDARCVADGADGGSCRWSGAPCDDGLACTPDGVCRRAVALGDPCGASTCAGGNRCDTACRREGAEGGWCRAGADPCEAGLVCVLSNRGPAYCARPLAAGALCDHTVTGACPAQQACVRDADSARCTPLPPATVACAGTSEGCPEGTRCASGVCARVVAAGQRCNLDTVACAEGSVCHPSRHACVSPGVAGSSCRDTERPCDEGLQCVGAEPTWPRAGRCELAGAVCGATRCAAGESCISSRCVADGGEGTACADAPSPCDEGLACLLARCLRAARVGEACDAASQAACEAGLQCRLGAEGARCAASPYAVVVREGVALEHPCAMPVTELTTPFVGRVLGVDMAVTLRDNGAFSWWPAAIQPLGEGVIQRDDDRYTGCRRVVGVAPARRFLWAGATWAAAGDVPEIAWEVVFYERTNVIEVRYDARSPHYVSPRIVAVPTAGYVAPAQRISRGTSLSFVPR